VVFGHRKGSCWNLELLTTFATLPQAAIRGETNTAATTNPGKKGLAVREQTASQTFLHLWLYVPG
jgi:hypothetical protein